MRTSEDWLVVSILPSMAETFGQRLQKRGFEVLDFRQEERVQVKQGRNKVWVLNLRPMYSGYLFVRGGDPHEFMERYPEVRFLRYEGGFAFVRARRIAHLQYLLGSRDVLKLARYAFLRDHGDKYKDFVGTLDHVREAARGTSWRVKEAPKGACKVSKTLSGARSAFAEALSS